MVGPALAVDPVERIVAVGSVVGIDAVPAFGAVAAPAILIDRGVAMFDDRFPAAQDRAAHWFGGARQPGVGVVEFVPRIGRRDPVRRPVQDYRETRAPTRRQEDKCVEPGSVAHRNHRLE